MSLAALPGFDGMVAQLRQQLETAEDMDTIRLLLTQFKGKLTRFGIEKTEVEEVGNKFDQLVVIYEERFKLAAKNRMLDIREKELARKRAEAKEELMKKEVEVQKLIANRDTVKHKLEFLMKDNDRLRVSIRDSKERLMALQERNREDRRWIEGRKKEQSSRMDLARVQSADFNRSISNAPWLADREKQREKCEARQAKIRSLEAEITALKNRAERAKKFEESENEFPMQKFCVQLAKMKLSLMEIEQKEEEETERLEQLRRESMQRKDRRLNDMSFCSQLDCSQFLGEDEDDIPLRSSDIAPLPVTTTEEMRRVKNTNIDKYVTQQAASLTTPTSILRDDDEETENESAPSHETSMVEEESIDSSPGDRSRSMEEPAPLPPLPPPSAMPKKSALKKPSQPTPPAVTTQQVTQAQSVPSPVPAKAAPVVPAVADVPMQKQATPTPEPVEEEEEEEAPEENMQEEEQNETQELNSQEMEHDGGDEEEEDVRPEESQSQEEQPERNDGNEQPMEQEEAPAEGGDEEQQGIGFDALMGGPGETQETEGGSQGMPIDGLFGINQNTSHVEASSFDPEALLNMSVTSNDPAGDFLSMMGNKKKANGDNPANESQMEMGGGGGGDFFSMFGAGGDEPAPEGGNGGTSPAGADPFSFSFGGGGAANESAAAGDGDNGGFNFFGF